MLMPSPKERCARKADRYGSRSGCVGRSAAACGAGPPAAPPPAGGGGGATAPTGPLLLVAGCSPVGAPGGRLSLTIKEYLFLHRLFKFLQ